MFHIIWAIIFIIKLYISVANASKFRLGILFIYCLLNKRFVCETSWRII